MFQPKSVGEPSSSSNDIAVHVITYPAVNNPNTVFDNTEAFEALELRVIFNESLDPGIQFTTGVLDVDLGNNPLFISLFVPFVFKGFWLPA